ncbi:hypothetical protein J1614_000065 [Plenodomus biglobosus]|nr:hypothetical protein J1614_000065 [Plenodomus biglobosus]
MQFTTTIVAFALAIALSSAAPATSPSPAYVGNLLIRQNSCLDHPCDFDTDCYAWRCGACKSNKKCECPPESEPGAC